MSAYLSIMPRRDDVFQITTADISVRDERHARTRRYLISMSIRTVCFLAGILIQGWLGLALMAAAVVLPYIAVVVANEVVRPRTHYLPPLIVKDPATLPFRHPDRTTAAP